MPIRSAGAAWSGGLKDGKGIMRLESGAYEGSYSFSSRFEEGIGTNPEELIAGAHAGCFSMALSGALGTSGHEPRKISTTARVYLEKGDAGFSITTVELETEGEVPGIDQATFQEHAERAKANCPVSRALGALEIRLKSARLLS